jgi:hypothetical protein
MTLVFFKKTLSLSFKIMYFYVLLMERSWIVQTGQPLIQWVPRALCQSVKWPKVEANHSPPSIAQD